MCSFGRGVRGFSSRVRMQGRAGAGPGGLRSHPRALPPVLPPPPQFASEQDEMPANQIAQVTKVKLVYFSHYDICIKDAVKSMHSSIVCNGETRDGHYLR